MPGILGRGRVCAEEKELTQRAQRKMAQRTRRRERRDGERRKRERRKRERRKRERRRREKNGSEDPPLQRIEEDANREIGVPRKYDIRRNKRERKSVMVWGAEQ